jgi:NADP-dependent 3-hydroxy acid dehydrogenase YdfG
MVLAQPANQHVSKAFDLSGKVAIVTGGSRGIGLEVARGLAEAGANVRCTKKKNRTPYVIILISNI